MSKVKYSPFGYSEPMSSSYAATRPTKIRSPLSLAQFFFQGILAITTGLALFFIALVGMIGVYDLRYANTIYPGVYMHGLSLSGLTVGQAAARIAEHLDYPTRGRIVFKDGEKVWVAAPRELGLFVDLQTSATNAFQIGREGNLANRLFAQFQAWSSGENLPPILIFDERTALGYLNDLAGQVDRPIIEASLGVNGVEVVVNSGQIGRAMDTQAALTSLRPQLLSLTDGVIPLIVKETPPIILDASQQAEVARKILSAPLVLSVPNAGEGDPGPWTFDPQTLVSMLTIERVPTADGARYQVGLKADSLRPLLEKAAPGLLRAAQDARFIFNDDTRQLEVIQPAVIGRKLDIDATIQDINQKVAAGEHNISLTIASVQPAVDDNATAEKLGIKELVSSQTSYFYGSPQARINNITVAAARFHGVLVPPGATLSMAEILGDVSLDTGYAEALIIYGNRTIKGVGGGVCQVSTVLFRTVFFGGYPIVERNPHAYRVGYYEQTASGGSDSNLAGLDATVFVPEVDFKFTNDRPYWLLMETYVDAAARTLTWKFYSTDDGRQVEWDTTGPQNIVEPPAPLYEENDELSKGEIVQVDWAADGAHVIITRTVTLNGEKLYDDTISTHYLPWRAVYQYGPGTKNIPKSEP